VKFDIGIITALPEIELPSVLNVFNLDPTSQEDKLIDNHRYWFSSIQSSKLQKKLTLVITCIGTCGIINSSSATKALIQKYDPDLLVFVGIAAGLKEKVNLLDIVISERVIGYEPARITPEGMEPRPQFEHPPYDILQDIRFSKQQIDNELLNNIFMNLQSTLDQSQLPPEPVHLVPQIHLGSIASGEKLFADGSLANIRKKYDEKIRAAEMEGIGFSMVSDQHMIPWIVVRGISDFGDPLTKDGRLKDKYHFSAANSASSWLRLFLEYIYSGSKSEEKIAEYDRKLCETIFEKIGVLIARHGLDDDNWAKAISSQYFLVSLAKILNLTNQKDYLNLLDKFLSSFHYNIKEELVLEKDHMLITPQETERIIHFLKKEDESDDCYTQSEKMKAENIDGLQMHNNYHYGLTLRIASSEKIRVFNEIKRLTIDKLIKSNNCLDEYGGWYPYRIPWITARILITFKESDYSDIDINGIDAIIQRSLESLVRRIYDDKYWRSGVGTWISKWESTALCLEALDKWDYVKQNVSKIRKVLNYVIENQNEWMIDPPNFSGEQESNDTLASIVMVSILLKTIKNNFNYEEFSINPVDYIHYFDNCIDALNKVFSPAARQFCTVPQILYYIVDCITSYTQ
jgi:nucleoside phosphorylase